MAKNLKRLLNHVFFGLPLYWYLIVIVWSTLFIRPVLTDQHLFYNLEPYPDSFTYIIPAKNLIEGRGFTMNIGEYQAVPNIVSAYSVVIGLGMSVFRSVKSVLLVNYFLYISNFFILYHIGKKLKLGWVIQVSSLLLFGLHFSLVWLVTLPLTENLTVPLLLFSTYLFVARNEKQNSTSTKWLLLSSFTSTILFFTRLSLIPLALIQNVVLSFEQLKKRKWREGLIFLILILVTVGVFLLLQNWMNEKVLDVLHDAERGSNDKYYSFSYLFSNLNYYVRLILGGGAYLLWQPVRLTSIVVSVVGVLGLIASANTFKKITYWLVAMGALSVSTLGVFYHQDVRYAIVIIPFLVLSTVLGWQVLINRKGKVLGGVCIVLTLLALIGTQLSLMKVVLKDTIFGKSTAWQYQAVVHFNAHLTQDAYIITALPPYLSQFYSTSAYTWLPLSLHQEYAQKQRWVWGDIEYNSLANQWQHMLREGSDLYISNAYITHNATVIADFERYKEIFNFELVSEGCIKACNIYKLSLKSSENSPRTTPVPVSN